MNYFSYRRSLSKLNRERDRIDKLYEKDIKEARAKGDYEKVQELERDEWAESSLTDEEISLLVTRYLLNKANKRFLPTPPINDTDGFWEKADTIQNQWLFTSKGITEVRSLIRKDRKETFELISPWMGTLIGLIGAATGLIAVIRR